MPAQVMPEPGSLHTALRPEATVSEKFIRSAGANQGIMLGQQRKQCHHSLQRS